MCCDPTDKDSHDVLGSQDPQKPEGTYNQDCESCPINNNILDLANREPEYSSGNLFHN
jgi:hypothetical protein